MKKTLFGFLMVGLAFTVLNVATAEANLKPGHQCYDIAPADRDGHACWPKGEDPSVSVEGSGERDVKDETQGLYLDTGKRHKGTDVNEEADKKMVRDAGRWLNGNTTNCAEGVNCKD